MPATGKSQPPAEETYVPRPTDWNGPLSRITCCSYDIERTMRPAQPLFLHALSTSGMWIYTMEGYVDFEEGGQLTRVGPGQVLSFRLPCRGSLINRKDGMPWRRIYIGVSGSAAMELFDHVIATYGHIYELPRESTAIREALKLCRLVKEKPHNTAQHWSTLTFQWMNSLWSDCSDRVSEKRDSKDIRGDESQLISLSQGSVTEFAKKMGYSRSYMSRRLKKIWNCDPSVVLRALRFEEARRLLRETRMPISEIAIQAGFSGNSSFGAAFKKEWGQTPLQYRHETITL